MESHLINGNICQFMGAAGNVLLDLFECIGKAEEIIAQMMAEYPDHRDEIWKSFSILRTTEPLRGKSMGLYEHHCRELIWRVINNEDVKLATDAELAGFLSDLSCKAPLNIDCVHVFHDLFQRIFPDKNIGSDNPESYAGAGDEIKYRLRRKLKQDRELS